MEAIVEKLGFTKERGLFMTYEKKWFGIFPKRIEEFFESDNAPDAFFCIDNKPFIFFYENPECKQKNFKSVWNFNKTSIVFIIKPDNIKIYNGFKYLAEKSTLSKIDSLEKENFRVC